MASGDRGNTSDSPGAEPGVTPGLEPGSGVRPGDTPPTADQMSGGGGDSRRGDVPNMGPVAGNRTPMIIALVLIGLMVLGVIGYGVAEITAYLREDPGAEQQGMAVLAAVTLLR